MAELLRGVVSFDYEYHGIKSLIELAIRQKQVELRRLEAKLADIESQHLSREAEL
jgi:hypothetical protein